MGSPSRDIRDNSQRYFHDRLERKVVPPNVYSGPSTQKLGKISSNIYIPNYISEAKVRQLSMQEQMQLFKEGDKMMYKKPKN